MWESMYPVMNTLSLLALAVVLIFVLHLHTNRLDFIESELLKINSRIDALSIQNRLMESQIHYLSDPRNFRDRR
jgi:cell division protein FtsL